MQLVGVAHSEVSTKQARSQGVGGGGFEGYKRIPLWDAQFFEIILISLYCSANIDVAKLMGTITIFTILHVGIVTIFTSSNKPVGDSKHVQIMNINVFFTIRAPNSFIYKPLIRECLVTCLRECDTAHFHWYLAVCVWSLNVCFQRIDGGIGVGRCWEQGGHRK